MEIKGFSGKYKFLSNMYPAKFVCNYGYTWLTAEHYYQASKAVRQKDFFAIKDIESPLKAKRYTKKILCIPNWDSIKDGIMFQSLRFKFYQNKDLQQKLISTGNSYIEETNKWNDIYWGVCNGQGQNKLGLMLMGIRKSLTLNQQNKMESTNYG